MKNEYKDYTPEELAMQDSLLNSWKIGSCVFAHYIKSPLFLFKFRVVALLSRTLSRQFCSKRRKRRVARGPLRCASSRLLFHCSFIKMVKQWLK